MGIPRLTARLQHKAEHVAWPVVETENDDEHDSSSSNRSKIAIIDGPGLAYHIFHAHVKAAARTLDKVELRVDYRAVYGSLLEFLGDLEQRGFVIHKIFFDGALPPSKTSTRISRLEQSVQRAVELRLSSEQKAKQAGRFFDSSDAFLNASWQGASWPPPPFLVPSMVEGLLKGKYASITEIVSGEADHYCSVAARQLASEGCSDVHILTSDSDLLVLNTTQGVKVAMFSSMTYDNAGILSADVFDPAAIARSAGLEDMLQVACRMQNDRTVLFEHAASQCSDLDPPGYAKFLEELGDMTVDVTFNAAQQQCLSRTDPRLSELVFQLAAAVSSTEPSMWLAVMVDDVHKSSAWKCGRSLRKLAYTLLAHESPVNNVREFDRRGDGVADAVIALYDDTPEAVTSHHAWLSEKVSEVLARKIAAPWRVVAAITVLCDLQAQNKALPSLADMMIIIQKHKLCSWAQIHLSAQLDAVLYSFRVLKLAMEFVLASPRNASDSPLFTDLSILLHGLPSLLELFDEICEHHAKGAEDLLRAYCADSAKAARPRKQKRKPGPAATLEATKVTKRQALASNPFAMLAD